MKSVLFTAISGLALLVSSSSILAAPDFDPKTAVSQPKTYVGSGVCKTCHLEHYDAWQRTLHSKMLQDVKQNADAFVTEIDEATVRADFAKIEDKLKVPSSEVFVPKMEDVLFTIGSQWKQRYLVKKDDIFYIAPTQFNIDTGRWVNYHEKDWDQRPWLLKCGGCHATGVDMEKQSFVEPGVGYLACGDTGVGRMAEPAEIVAAVEGVLAEANPGSSPSD